MQVLDALCPIGMPSPIELLQEEHLDLLEEQLRGALAAPDCDSSLTGAVSQGFETACCKTLGPAGGAAAGGDGSAGAATHLYESSVCFSCKCFKPICPWCNHQLPLLLSTLTAKHAACCLLAKR